MGSSHSVHSSDEVKLVWVKNHRTCYQRVSLNVVREVCGYLASCFPLIAVFDSKVLSVDLISARPALLFALTEQISVGTGSAFLLVGPKKVFVCGGDSLHNCGNLHAESAEAYLLSPGRVRKLSEMSVERKGSGLFHDAGKGCVYVFGGYRARTSLNDSEKLALRKKKWEGLPDMKCARRYFNPCAKQSLLYLVGGWATSIETYDPARNCFTLLPLSLDQWFENSSCTAVVYANSLVVLSLHCIYQSDECVSAWVRNTEHAPVMVWSNCSPLVIDGKVFVVSMLDLACRGISVCSGEKEVEIDLRNDC